MQIHRRRMQIACLIIFMMTVAACGANFARDQYRALTIAQNTYNLTWGAFKRFYDDKVMYKGKLLISDEIYADGLKKANEYYDTWNDWIDAVMMYERMKSKNAKLTVHQKADLFSKAASDLLDLIEPYVKKGREVQP